MYSVPQAFHDAVSAHKKQRIWGTLGLANGTGVALGDNIIGSPVIETQIVEDSEVFSLSSLYVGTLDILLKLELGENDLIGAHIELYTAVEGVDTVVPMGVFDVADAQRQSEYTLKITGYDHMARLQTPLPNDGVGWHRFVDIMADIEENANIRFEQTASELLALNPEISGNLIFAFSYAPTCWQQIQYMAQILGCYVIANRSGFIEFRRYKKERWGADTPVLTIPASQRHSARISQYEFGVSAFSYTDKYDHTYTLPCREHDVSSVIVLPQENNFIHDQDEDYEQWYNYCLKWLGIEFSNLSWHAGTVDYYGDPTLDVGDLVELTGGINGDESVNFLICHNTWQFRGAQTLISGGAPRAGNVVTSSGGGGGAVYSSTSVNVTKTIVTVPLTVYEDMLLGNARTAAIGGISAKEQTQVFITCTFQLLGTADSTAPKLTVTVDGERVGTAPQITLGEGDRGTIAFTCPVQVSGGNHTVKILAENYAEISGTAEVSGQNISAHTVTADLTDWEYETDENSASVTGYSGSEVNVEIPDIMGGKTVKIIKESAFEGSAAETVYIPEGVEKIE